MADIIDNLFGLGKAALKARGTRSAGAGAITSVSLVEDSYSRPQYFRAIKTRRESERSSIVLMAGLGIIGLLIMSKR